MLWNSTWNSFWVRAAGYFVLLVVNTTWETLKGWDPMLWFLFLFRLIVFFVLVGRLVHFVLWIPGHFFPQGRTSYDSVGLLHLWGMSVQLSKQVMYMFVGECICDKHVIDTALLCACIIMSGWYVCGVSFQFKIRTDLFVLCVSFGAYIVCVFVICAW